MTTTDTTHYDIAAAKSMKYIMRRVDELGAPQPVGTPVGNACRSFVLGWHYHRLFTKGEGMGREHGAAW